MLGCRDIRRLDNRIFVVKGEGLKVLVSGTVILLLLALLSFI